jgi:hypothetical protein
MTVAKTQSSALSGEIAVCGVEDRVGKGIVRGGGYPGAGLPQKEWGWRDPCGHLHAY